ncbi:MAG: type II toxin-antitoxin system RelE/ParE family toxin [Marinilabiliaceae bacterium]|nr:type II toxin-antitoxin system RelE/ParE family toxin [Marinilabiliaceae bacterium]
MAGFNIVWTSAARKDLKSILAYFIKRNGNTHYSRKLHTLIKEKLKLLAQNPHLGFPTDLNGVKIIHIGPYQIIYEITHQTIIIVMIWDNRQDPDKKNLMERV